MILHSFIKINFIYFNFNFQRFLYYRFVSLDTFQQFTLTIPKSLSIYFFRKTPFLFWTRLFTSSLILHHIVNSSSYWPFQLCPHSDSSSFWIDFLLGLEYLSKLCLMITQFEIMQVVVWLGSHVIEGRKVSFICL